MQAVLSGPNNQSRHLENTTLRSKGVNHPGPSAGAGIAARSYALPSTTDKRRKAAVDMNTIRDCSPSDGTWGRAVKKRIPPSCAQVLLGKLHQCRSGTANCTHSTQAADRVMAKLPLWFKLIHEQVVGASWADCLGRGPSERHSPLASSPSTAHG